MPQRVDTQAQVLLLPPSLDELVGADNPMRYVASFVDTLPEELWQELGVNLESAREGAPRYAPKLVLRVWLSGFMVGIRSARGLERGCRERFDLYWAAGGQHPSYSTLARFYAAYRVQMRRLLRETVTTAVAIGLVDLAVQAVDGTKIVASANPDATLTSEQLAELEHAIEQAIADLEAQTQGDSLGAPQLPVELQDAERLRQRIARVRERQDEADPPTLNRTDPDASWMRTRQGIQPAYNAQLVVTPTNPAVGGGAGRIILAAQVTTQANDVGQLAPMAQAAQVPDHLIPVTLADAGYSSAASLLQADAAGITVVAPLQRHRQQQNPYAKEHFQYDPATDTWRCPEEQVLTRRGRALSNGVPAVRYQADAKVCQACPAYQACTTSQRNGRLLKITVHDERLRQQADWMATEQAQTLSAQRKGLIEGVFGILKERLGARRTLLRGRAAVEAEWVLTATAFNLKTLARAQATATQRSAGALAA